MRENIETIGIPLLLVVSVFITIGILEKNSPRTKCWEMPYNEYKKDTRCQALLEDK